jgi:hypothetical protein
LFVRVIIVFSTHGIFFVSLRVALFFVFVLMFVSVCFCSYSDLTPVGENFSKSIFLHKFARF